MAKKTRFIVWPETMKPRSYDNLESIKQDFLKEELIDSIISVVYGCVVVGKLITENVLDEVYN